MKKRFFSVLLCILLVVTSIYGTTVSADNDTSLNPIFTDFESLKEVVEVCSDFAESGRQVFATYSSSKPLVISENIVIPDNFYLAVDNGSDVMIINEGVTFEMEGSNSTLRTNTLIVNGTLSADFLSVSKELTVNGALHFSYMLELWDFDTLYDSNGNIPEPIRVTVNGIENIFPKYEDSIIQDCHFVNTTENIKKVINEANTKVIDNWIYYITVYDSNLVIDESLTFPANTCFETSYWEPKTITIEEGCMITLNGGKWDNSMPIINKGVIYNNNGSLILTQSDIPTSVPGVFLDEGCLKNIGNGYYLDNGTNWIYSPRNISPFDTLIGVDSSSYSIEKSGIFVTGTNYWNITHNCKHSLSDFITSVTTPKCNDKGYTTYTCEKCGESFKYNFTPATGIHTYDNKNDAYCNGCDFVRGLNVPSVPMYRMYDPNSGEHFYTGSTDERDFLVNAGWKYEGVGFNFPVAGRPVHRLYEPITGEHLYTMDEAEKAKLLSEGWNYEGVAFNSGGDNEVAQYRLHNPNSTRGAYHFTGSEEERDILISAGWEYQGIGFYSCVK